MHLLSKAGRLALAAMALFAVACSRPAKPTTPQLPPPPPVVYENDCEPGDKLPECEEGDRAGSTRSTTARYGFGQEFGQPFGREFGRSFGEPDTSAPANDPPVVNAGSDTATHVGTGTTFAADCTDALGGSLTCTWTHTSGGGSCSFTPGATTVDAAVDCDTAGTHVFTLTGDDGIASPVPDTVTVTFYEEMLLDQMATATSAAAFSFQEKLRYAYSGSLFRVRRASDNAETDIGALASGQYDSSALSTHCTGTDCFVVTAYDQSTNGRNYTQATAGNQPQIWDSSTGAITCGTTSRLCARWDGTADRLVRADSSGFVGDVEWGVTILVREHGSPGSGDRFFVATGSVSGGRSLGILRAAAARNIWTTMTGQNCVFATTGNNVASGTFQGNFMYRAAGTQLQNVSAETNGLALTFSSSSNPTNLANVQNTASSWGDGLNSGSFFGQIESSDMLLWSTYPRTTDKTAHDAWITARD